MTKQFVSSDGRLLRDVIQERINLESGINWETIASLFNFELLSVIGKDRVAFRTNADTVVKVARDSWAAGLNEDEYLFWSTFGTPDLFAPVMNTAPDFVWVEMPYCQPAPDKIGKYKQKIAERAYTVPDLTTSCIGWYNDSIVCFDYPEATV